MGVSEESTGEARLTAAYPQLFTRDMERAAAFYREQFGFEVRFLFGDPPVYAQFSRDTVRLNMRQVDAPVLDREAAERGELLAAYLEVDDVEGLYREYAGRDVDFYLRLQMKPWGLKGFIVRDPDGNLLNFSEPADPS
ncbi:MAG: VOC family protein [Dehalococcoidia bacterium]|nr:VOC family protein [Dehalococcoidia bacterium]